MQDNGPALRSRTRSLGSLEPARCSGFTTRVPDTMYFFFANKIHFFANFGHFFAKWGRFFAKWGLFFANFFDHVRVLYSEPSASDRSMSQSYQRTSTPPPSSRPAPTQKTRPPALPAPAQKQPPSHSQLAATSLPSRPPSFLRCSRACPPLLEIRAAKARKASKIMVNFSPSGVSFRQVGSLFRQVGSLFHHIH